MPFFRTGTIGELHWLTEGTITPASSISASLGNPVSGLPYWLCQPRVCCPSGCLAPYLLGPSSCLQSFSQTLMSSPFGVSPQIRQNHSNSIFSACSRGRFAWVATPKAIFRRYDVNEETYRRRFRTGWRSATPCEMRLCWIHYQSKLGSGSKKTNQKPAKRQLN